MSFRFLAPRPPHGERLRTVVVFNTTVLFGMERTVTQTFSGLLQEMDVHFVVTQALKRRHLSLLQELERRGLEYSFLSDDVDWPKVGRPRTLRQVWPMVNALVRGNLDVLRASRSADVLYLPGLHYLYYALLAALNLRLRRRRVLYAFHDVVGRPSLALRLLHYLITDYIIPSRYVMATNARIHPYLRRDRFSVLAPTVEFPRGEGDRPFEDYRDQRNILFAGQVAPHKGVGVLIRAFAAASACYPDAMLHVVGSGDAAYSRSLHRLVRDLGLSDRVRFWGFRDDVPAMLRDAYLFVQPSIPHLFNESFGRGVVEAMAAGVPSIVFRSGALQETVQHELTGLICDEPTPAELARALDRLLGNSSLRDTLGVNARRRYESQFSPAHVHQEWLRLLHGTLAPDPVPEP